MKSLPLKILSMLLLCGIFPTSLQAQVWDEIQKSLFHPQAALEEVQLKQEIQQQAQNLSQQGLPGEIYSQKAEEGFAKGASFDSIRSALNETEQQLRQAEQLTQALPGLNSEQKNLYAREIFWTLKRGNSVDKIRQLSQGQVSQDFRKQLRALREKNTFENFNFKPERIKNSASKNEVEFSEPRFQKSKTLKNRPKLWDFSEKPHPIHPLKDPEIKQKHHPKK